MAIPAKLATESARSGYEATSEPVVGAVVAEKKHVVENFGQFSQNRPLSAAIAHFANVRSDKKFSKIRQIKSDSQQCARERSPTLRCTPPDELTHITVPPLNVSVAPALKFALKP